MSSKHSGMRCIRSNRNWRQIEESGQRVCGVHDRLGNLFCVFADGGEADVEFERRVVSPEGTAAGFLTEALVAKGKCVERAKENRHRAVSVGRAGLARGG